MSKGFQGLVLKDIERRRKEKEEIREKEDEALPNHDCNQLLYRSSFDVLRSSSS